MKLTKARRNQIVDRVFELYRGRLRSLPRDGPAGLRLMLSRSVLISGVDYLLRRHVTLGSAMQEWPFLRQLLSPNMLANYLATGAHGLDDEMMAELRDKVRLTRHAQRCGPVDQPTLARMTSEVVKAKLFEAIGL